MFAGLTSTVRNYPSTIAGLLFAALLTVGVGAYLVGCAPKVQSIVTPGQKVDAAGLSGEAMKLQGDLDTRAHALQQQIADYTTTVTTVNAELQQRTDSLKQQEATRAQVMQIAGGVISSIASGNFNPVGLAGTGVSLLMALGGAGAMVDKSARLSVVNNLRSQLNTTTNTDPTTGAASPATPGATAAAATPAAATAQTSAAPAVVAQPLAAPTT